MEAPTAAETAADLRAITDTGWVENYTSSIAREAAARMSARVQSLLGYSIHPPFMGHVRGLHPRRLLA